MIIFILFNYNKYYKLLILLPHIEEITDDFIFEKLASTTYSSEFTLQDLIGKTFIAERTIPYRKFREPRKMGNEKDPEDPHVSYRIHSDKLGVIIFNDQTFLATECRGDGGNGLLCQYYLDGKRTLYSDRLFETTG